MPIQTIDIVDKRRYFTMPVSQRFSPEIHYSCPEVVGLVSCLKKSKAYEIFSLHELIMINFFNFQDSFF